MFTESAPSHFEHVYLRALKDVLETGKRRVTRNATTISKFGVKLDFDIRNQFPLLTTKKMYWHGIVGELLWFLRGDTNANHLDANRITIWNPNTTREYLDNNGLNHYVKGDCGPIYGYQWRRFNATYRGCDASYDEHEGVDQLQQCIDLIRYQPESRRIFMSAWNPLQLGEMCLPPCHISYQFHVEEDTNELSCMMYQRSGDMFLGIPFNIASVALLVYLISHITGRVPGSITLVIGDAHIYESHIDSVRKQLERDPFPAAQLRISGNPQFIEDYVESDIGLFGYVAHPAIRAAMVA
jgi:thymidylate synthase